MTREEALKIRPTVIGECDNRCGYEDEFFSKNRYEILINQVFDDFELRTCNNCKLQYDKYCPIAEAIQDFKYCSEWEQK